MTQTPPAASLLQRAYLFALRAMGWLGLMFVPVFAFGWATGALRPEASIAVALLVAAPGVLVSLFLGGLPDRPGFLLRPTSFLKGFFVVGAVIGLASGAIAVQVLALVLPLDLRALLAALGAGEVARALDGLAGLLLGPGGIGKMRAVAGGGVPLALALVLPGAALANLATILAWVTRFPAAVPAPELGAPAERIAPRRPAYDEEKGRAVRAMRRRLLERGAAGGAG